MSPECGYCGVVGLNLEREHVIPKCLYPLSKAKSKVRRITVPACSACNRGWSDDEAHFRTVVLMSGEPNDAVRELWSKARRSFYKRDGIRRALDVRKLMVPVQIAGESRWKIYPANDVRVLRVVRKVVRGLSYYHRLGVVASDEAVHADILKEKVPNEALWSETLHHCEPDIFRYWFEQYDEGEVRSIWWLKFFERLPFIAWVTRPG
jgi:hypothetical protein